MSDNPKEAFEFPWLLSKVVLEGLSILDVPKLNLTSIEEATEFVQAYGYDLTSSEDLKMLWGYFDNAVAFIEKTLTDPEFPTVPEHLKNKSALKDIRRILIFASSHEGLDQTWACAILRVMHVLIHIVHDPRLRYFEQVQNQVISRLDNHLYVESSDGAIHLGRKEEGGGIKLLFFKKKDRKDRSREVIKLLHKAESTVEVIYDRIGFRLVTETKYDAIRAIKFLVTKNIISIPNIRPSRSRNTLVDMEKFRQETEKVIALIEKSEHTKKPITDANPLIKKLERRIGFRRTTRSLINPHTSSHYRAIQFTCRELVRVRNPMYQVYSRLKNQLEKIPGGQQILHEGFPEEVNPYEYVFFPYEIQIVDVKSYADSIFGRSSHEEYRRKQLEVARNRTFGRGLKPKPKKRSRKPTATS